MNTLIYNNGIAIAQIDGNQLENSIKPEFSFQYDGLQFHENSSFYELNGERIEMTDAQKSEVTSFIAGIKPNEALSTQLMTNEEARLYLLNTDWYVARFYEIGTEIPQEIKDKRAEARSLITDLSEFAG